MAINRPAVPKVKPPRRPVIWLFLVGFLVFASFAVALFLGWRTLARAAVAEATSVGAEGVSSLEKVILGGVEQWILIRGRNPRSDVILFVHGGPGLPNMPLCHLQAELEQHFVVVQWDQRGSGKSYSRDLPPESMEIARFVSDAAELTDWLRRRFSQDRIFLLGHSWGSIVGLKTVSRHPDRFRAYVGVSQVTSVMAAQQLVYHETLDKARARGTRKAVDELELIGPPPFAKPSDHIAACQWLAKLEGRPPLFRARLVREAFRSPYYTLGDFIRYRKGANLTVDRLWKDLEGVDLRSEIVSLAIPVVFIQGESDSLIPGELIEHFASALEAPSGKELISIKNAGHLPHLENPDEFVKRVVNALRKYQTSNDRNLQ